MAVVAAFSLLNFSQLIMNEKMPIIKELTRRAKSLPNPAIIAISGFGGAGKSTFAIELGIEMCIPVIGVDSFIIDLSITNYSNWELIDFSRLESEVLIPFSKGDATICYGQFDWNSNSVLNKKQVSHNGLIIVEGVGLFRPELLKYFHLRVWIDCSIEEAIKRGKKRDRETYNNPQDDNWDGIWRRNDEEYWIASSPRAVANFIV